MFPRSLIEKLFPLLLCPGCRGKLFLESGKLRCVSCRLLYDHEQGIPILLS
ncbi:Trm112 family protein [Candidatus Gottesmanbacteria bacterium]|nr:Trm112 family protein [Candidatus Gottesmanbacteria bacterium]